MFKSFMEPEVIEDDGVICSERIRPRKMKSQNIVHRLRNREHFGNKSSIAHHSFYQCVFPNLTVSCHRYHHDNLLITSRYIEGCKHRETGLLSAKVQP